MKNMVAILLAAMMMLSVTACSSDKEEPSSDSAPTSQNEEVQEEEPDAPADTEQPEETPAEDSEQPKDTSAEDSEQTEEQTVSGKVTEISDDSVTVEIEDGTALTFPLTEDVDKTQAENIASGDTLEITYTGSVEDSDTSNAVVVKLVQTPADAQ